MIDEAIDCETQFAEDLLGGGVAGPVGRATCAQYLEYCADQRLATLGLPKRYGAKNPFGFMDLQDVQEVDELLRAPRLGLPGRRDRRGRARRRVLKRSRRPDPLQLASAAVITLPDMISVPIVVLSTPTEASMVRPNDASESIGATSPPAAPTPLVELIASAP